MELVSLSNLNSRKLVWSKLADIDAVKEKFGKCFVYTRNIEMPKRL